MFSVGDISLGLKLDSASLSKDINLAAKSAGDSVKVAFRNMGYMAGNVLGAALSGAFINECLELGSNLAEVQNVVDVTFGSMAEKINDFSKNAMENFGLSETVAKKYTGTIGSMAKAFGFAGEDVVKMSTSLAGLTADVSSFYNLDTDTAFTKLKSIFTGETEALKDLGVVMTQTALDQYALNNGFGMTTSEMTEQMKVMLRYQFVTSQLADASGDFARTQDGWANQTRVLELRFDALKATLGQSLINVLTPVIQLFNELLGTIQGCADELLEFTNIMSGNVIEETITKNAQDAAGAIDDIGNSAEESAKKLNKLAGYDELNVLNQGASSATSSSGGGNTPSIDVGEGDVVSQLDPDKNIISKYLASIKEAWENADFTDFGESLSSKIKKSLEKVDWNKIESTGGRLASSLATFLNGLFDKDTFKEVGKTVAGAVNTAIHTTLKFAEDFDFKNFGESMAAGINGFFEDFDFKDLANSIDAWVDGIGDAIKGFADELDWGKIFDGAKEFFSELDIDTVALVVGTLTIKSIASSGLGTVALSTLKSGIISSISSMGGIGGMLTTDMSLIVGAGSAAEIGTLLGGAIIGGIGAAIAGWNIGLELGKLINPEDSEYYDNFSFSEFFEYLTDDFGITLDALMMMSADFEESIIGDTFIKKYLPSITPLLLIKGEMGNIKDLWDKIKSSVKKLNITANVTGQKAIESIKNLWSKITGGTKKILVNAKVTGQTAMSKIKNTWSDIKTGDKSLKAVASGVIKSSLNSLKSSWSSLATKNILATASGKQSDTLSKLKTVWDALKTKAIELKANVPTFASIKEKLKKLLNGIIEFFNEHIIDNLNGIFKVDIPKNNLTKYLGIDGLAAQILSLDHLDAFAQGAYVKANTPRLAIIGDNTHEGEFVAPESKLEKAVINAMEKMGYSKEKEETIINEIYIDSELVERRITDRKKARDKQTGGS